MAFYQIGFFYLHSLYLRPHIYIYISTANFPLFFMFVIYCTHAWSLTCSRQNSMVGDVPIQRSQWLIEGFSFPSLIIDHALKCVKSPYAFRTTIPNDRLLSQTYIWNESKGKIRWIITNADTHTPSSWNRNPWGKIYERNSNLFATSINFFLSLLSFFFQI